MDTKPVFHGSDIEKICSYYNLKKENIVIRCKCQSSGTFPKSRQSHCRTRGYPFLLPGQRIHIPSEYDFQLLQYSR